MYQLITAKLVLVVEKDMSQNTEEEAGQKQEKEEHKQEEDEF
jgi:hypothetical protein